MSALNALSLRRYPGLKPFDRSQNALFRGRQDDILRLSNLIIRGRLTVLFAKSGIGKTSLLQAGVSPELEAQGLYPVFLRAENSSRSLVENTTMTLERAANAGRKDERGRMPEIPETLWELLKRLKFESGGLPATPVLVFDQFEEVFTMEHTQASRDAFLEQLADLCNESTPENVHDKLIEMAQGKGDEAMAPEIMQWWDNQPEVRIVISIRSDFLHKMDEISTLIPGILRNRYQLQPLTRAQATEAIVTPAAAVGPFVSPVFKYAQEALNTILDFLGGRSTSVEVSAVDQVALLKKQDEIEAFNLQIICQNIEEEIIKGNQPADFEVTPAFFGGRAGLENEISDFYIRQTKSLPDLFKIRTGQPAPDSEAFIHTARCLIEEDLITSSGRRNSVVQETLLDKWKIPSEFLDVLVECRLLRKELRLDSYYFEISHDTLLPAAISARDTRRAREKQAEEKAKLTQELREEALKRKEIEDQLKEAKRQRRLARLVSILAIGCLVLGGIMGILFFRAWADSVEKEFQAAEENCRKEQFDAATEGYFLLSNYTSKNWLLGGNIAEKGKDLERFKQLYKATSREQSKGDSLFFLEQNPDYAAALTAYRNAADSLEIYRSINYSWTGKKDKTYWRVEPERINDRAKSLQLRIKSTRQTLITQFIVHQREAESFKEAGLWGQQRRNLLQMQRLLPAHAEDLHELETQLNLRNLSPETYVRRELAECERRM